MYSTLPPPGAVGWAGGLCWHVANHVVHCTCRHLLRRCAAGLQDTQPPKAPDMFVRVLQDCGNVAFSTGSVTLKKGSTHFLPQAEADHLIQEGVLAPSESGPIEAFTTPFDYI